MGNFSESLIRECVRAILAEDVYSGGKFSPERLRASVQGYLGGELPSRGVRPEVASEVALEDLRGAFFAMGYDSDRVLQDAVRSEDPEAAEDRVWDILTTDFIGPRGPLSGMSLRSVSDILLPGDEDTLVQMIVSSVFRGDVF